MTFPKFLAAGATVLALGAAAPAWAADENPGGPVELTDAELDEVTAGESILDILGINFDANVSVLVGDINVGVDVCVPVDVGLIAQLNVLGTAVLEGVNTFLPDTMQ